MKVSGTPSQNAHCQRYDRAIQQISEIKLEHKLSYRCSLLIAITIAEEIQGLQGLQKVLQVLTFCVFFGFGKKFSESWETPCQSRGKLRSSKLAEPPNPKSLDLFCNAPLKVSNSDLPTLPLILSASKYFR